MSAQTSEHLCPACGRVAPETGPCGQCGAELRALQLLWALPPAVPAAPAPQPQQPPVPPTPRSRAWLAPLFVGLAAGLGAGVPTGLRLAGAPPSPASTPPVAAQAASALASPVPPVAPVPAASFRPEAAVRLHRIVPGDTLGALALEAYGDEDRFDLLIAANPGVRPRALRVGATLRIPPRPTPTTRSTP